jgi:uncharacterized radical SAM superfamily protein
MKQNSDLIDTVKKLNEEKIGYKNAIVKLEDEIRQFKRNNHRVCKYDFVRLNNYINQMFDLE